MMCERPEFVQWQRIKKARIVTGDPRAFENAINQRFRDRSGGEHVDLRITRNSFCRKAVALPP